MAVNDKIEDTVREEQEGFEIIDTILDKLNEVTDVSTSFTSSVSGSELTKVSFNITSLKGSFTLEIAASIKDSKGTVTKTGSIALK